MSRYKRRLVLPILALSACAAAVALACGPQFSMLLYDRQATLREPIGSDFRIDARTLAPQPKVKYRTGTGSERYAIEPDKARAEVELRDLTPEQRKSLLAMRAAPDGDGAYALGTALPPAVRLYTAAAVDFRLGRASFDDACAVAAPDPVCMTAKRADDGSKKRARQRAEARFRAVLELPETDARARATWAAFMLGRVLREDGRDDEADAAWRRTRDLAERGMPDPLALAEASLGEQARRHFEAGAWRRAAELYAEQAAHGSAGGANSLRVIAEKLVAEPAKLKEHIRDPLLQKLVVSYALDHDENNRTVTLWSFDDADLEVPRSAKLDAVAAAIASLGPEQIVQADRLAALAYDTGRFALAGKLAGQARGPLASWVEAKLAMRRGDSETAARYYADAAKAFPQLGEGIAGNPRQARLVLGERAVLQLARGEYTQALAQLYAVGGHYWPDLAYVAERVVSSDELKSFVDANVPRSPAPRVQHEGNASYVESEDGSGWPSSNTAAQLRDLLARRLVREGRIAEAGPYFHDPADMRFAVPSWWGDKGPNIPDARKAAEDYGRALRAAGSAWTAVGRAREQFAAARLARTQGMAIMGYELAPDHFMANGDFEFETTAPDPEGRALVGRGEAERYHASVAYPEKRFHYRYLAADLALKAADAVPHRSQAYAAMLCQATGWLIDRDDEKAQEIYRRYLRNGAMVPWAIHFGRSCPEPQFDRAARMALAEEVSPLLRPFKRHPRRSMAGLVLLLLAGGGVLWRRKRRASGVAR